jgi:hypothetical protein
LLNILHKFKDRLNDICLDDPKNRFIKMEQSITEHKNSLKNCPPMITMDDFDDCGDEGSIAGSEDESSMVKQEEKATEKIVRKVVKKVVKKSVV